MRAVFVALGGVALHFIAGIVCGFALVWAAFAYPGIEGLDDLWRFGEAPRLGFAALIVVGIAETFTTFALLSDARTRPHAWISPLIGITIIVVTTIFAIARYEGPLAIVGG